MDEHYEFTRPYFSAFYYFFFAFTLIVYDVTIPPVKQLIRASPKLNLVITWQLPSPGVFTLVFPSGIIPQKIQILSSSNSENLNI